MEVKINKDLDLLDLLRSTGFKTSWVVENLEEEYATLFETDNAKNLEGVVYIYKAKEEVQRLKGSSPILYIGKANGSLWGRYSLKEELRTFGEKFQHVLDNYGGFTVELFKTDEPEKLESLLLWQFSKKYLELPSLNTASYLNKHIEDFI